MTDLTTLTIEELKQGREETFSEEMLQDIDAELRRREQAQHTPGPWRYTEARIMGSKGWVVRQTKTDDDICLVHPSHEGTEANAALIARAPELAAENERLRGLLADVYSELLSHYLSRAGDLGIPYERAMAMIIEMPLMRRIKAAKEIRNA